MIRPLPETKKREFRSWVKISSFACAFVCLVLLLFTTKELYYLVIITTACKNLQEQIQSKSSQSQIIEQLQQKIKLFTTQKNKFERYHNYNKPHALLRNIAEIMPADAALTRFAYEKNSIELTGQAPDQSAVFNLLKKLAEMPSIKKSDLIALQQATALDQFNFSIKATMVH